MRYLSGVVNDAVRAGIAAEYGDLGLMAQPRSCLDRDLTPGRVYAFDNGAFAAWKNGTPFDVGFWRRWLTRQPVDGSLFAVCPDVVCDHAATLRLWSEHADWIAAGGLTPAFVLQNGCEDPAQVPADAVVVFIGGDDAYKLGPQAAYIAQTLHDRGVWVHMGRVNSEKRWRRAVAMGCDSADGTYCRFGPPEQMVANVRRWLAQGRRCGGQTTVWDHVGGAVA